jgi:hypothetical protein
MDRDMDLDMEIHMTILQKEGEMKKKIKKDSLYYELD